MSEIPIAFILFLIVAAVLLRLSLGRDKRFGGLPRLTLAVYAVQSVIIGLKWNYGISLAWPLQAALATLIPPLTWMSLRTMVSASPLRLTYLTLLQIGLPTVLVMVSPLLNLESVDIIIIAVFLGYGIALLTMTFREDLEWLDRIPFQGIISTSVAFRAAGAGLIGSALVDLFVAYDIRHTGGSLAPGIVGFSNLVLVIVLSVSIALVGRFMPQPHAEDDAAAGADAADEENRADALPPELYKPYAETLTQLDQMMLTKHVYRDPNLSLGRLARKLTVPSRQISAAINSLRAMNVPQYVNMFRIMEACDVLKNTDTPITEIVFQVGFQTKSNFNREFQRITGMSPSAWRQDRAARHGDSSPMRSFLDQLGADVGPIARSAIPAEVLTERKLNP